MKALCMVGEWGVYLRGTLKVLGTMGVCMGFGAGGRDRHPYTLARYPT